MKAQMKNGVLKEDVWNYGFVGCVEMTIPGKEKCDDGAGKVESAKASEPASTSGERYL